MIKIKFTQFMDIISKGYVDGALTTADDELYLDPKLNIDNKVHFFITDFSLKRYQKPDFPIELNNYKPFIKSQKNKSKQEVQNVQMENNYFDFELWDSTFNIILYYYIYITYGLNKNPWDLINSKALELEGEGSIYDFCKDENLNPYIDIFETNKTDEYIQVALINEVISSRLLELLKGMNTDDNFENYIVEKGSKWAAVIKRNGIDFLWKNILIESKNKSKDFHQNTIVLICYLFALDAYYRRIGIHSSFKRIKEILLQTKSITKLNNNLKFELILIKFFSQNYKNSNLVKEVVFLPDYYLINYITQSIYSDICDPKKMIPCKDTNRLNNTEIININKKLTFNFKKEITYLSISGKPTKKGPIGINIELNYLKHIDNLPPYIYKKIIRNLLQVNLQLYEFTKNKLKILPEKLFNDFMKYKSEKQYNLKSKMNIDTWLDEYQKNNN